MLTISKPLSAGQAQTYHQKEFTAREQNYWSQRGVIQGQHPQTGEQLVRQRESYQYQDVDGKTVKTMEHRAGWPATFSAPARRRCNQCHAEEEEQGRGR